MENFIFLSDDLSGSVSYPDGSLPLFTLADDISHFGDIRIPHHWHFDLEFIYLTDGWAKVCVNDKTVTLLPGQGVFINSRSLHHVSQNDRYKGIMVRIHPDIFKAGFQCCSEYFNRKFTSGNPGYILLDGSEDWHRDVLKAVVEVRKCDLEIADHPLSALASVFALIELVGDHIEEVEFGEKDNQNYDVFLEMVKYLHKNFDKKVNIDVMADELAISRTKAYRLFEKYAHTSPNTYLNFYRLILSQQMLIETDLSIYEIASKCGFQTSSYFTKIFGKELGVSPKVYREQNKTNN